MNFKHFDGVSFAKKNITIWVIGIFSLSIKFRLGVNVDPWPWLGIFDLDGEDMTTSQLVKKELGGRFSSLFPPFWCKSHGKMFSHFISCNFSPLNLCGFHFPYSICLFSFFSSGTCMRILLVIGSITTQGMRGLELWGILDNFSKWQGSATLGSVGALTSKIHNSVSSNWTLIWPVGMNAF